MLVWCGEIGAMAMKTAKRWGEKGAFSEVSSTLLYNPSSVYKHTKIPKTGFF
jgi:hypothetical protein